MKELNQFTPGDYVVHTDHGIGRFSGLVRIPNGDTTQEVLKLVFQNEDVCSSLFIPCIRFPNIKVKKERLPGLTN